MTKFSFEERATFQGIQECFSRFALKPENIRPETTGINMVLSPDSIEVVVYTNLLKSMTEIQAEDWIKLLKEAFVNGTQPDFSSIEDFYRADYKVLFFQKKQEGIEIVRAGDDCSFNLSEKDQKPSPHHEWYYFTKFYKDTARSQDLSVLNEMRTVEGICDHTGITTLDENVEVCCFVSDALSFMREFFNLLPYPSELADEVCKSVS